MAEAEQEQVASEPGRAPVVGRRRRRANVSGGRSVRHYVKVSPVEEEALAVAAAGRGITVARLLVESALAGGGQSAAVDGALLGELFGISRALGRVGVNVNQIARATNATGEIQLRTEASLAALRVVCARIEAVLAGLPGGHGGAGAVVSG